MSSNKNARKALEDIYGKKDMFVEAQIEAQIDEINLTRKKKIRTYREFKEQCKFKGSKRRSMEKMMSYHHLRHKKDKGDSSVENGVLITALPHSYIHSLPRNEEELINNMFREYKANFSIGCVSMKVKDKEIEIQALEPEEVEMELPPEIEAGEIKLEPMTEEEQKKYEEYKRQRAEKVYKDKFKYNPALDINIQRPKAHLDEEWKRQIHREILEELGL